MQIRDSEYSYQKNYLPDGYYRSRKNSVLSNHFDDRLDDIISIAEQLIVNKGVFHLTIQFASSQLVCWTYDNPFSYQIYHAEEVFNDNFMRLFAPLTSGLHTCIRKEQVNTILQTLKHLRQLKDASELRNASIHMINGYISLSFACDDTRHINHKDFMKPLGAYTR